MGCPRSKGNAKSSHRLGVGLPIERIRAGAYRSIHNQVARLSPEARQHPVLIIDEGHHLRNEVQEGLRQLSNCAMETEQRLGLLLI